MSWAYWAPKSTTSTGAVGEVDRLATLDDGVVDALVVRHTGLRAGGVAHAAKATGGRQPTRASTSRATRRSTQRRGTDPPGEHDEHIFVATSPP